MQSMRSLTTARHSQRPAAVAAALPAATHAPTARLVTQHLLGNAFRQPLRGVVFTRVASVVTESATHTKPAPTPDASPQLDWFDAWYPVAFERDVAKDAPYRMQLLGIELVIWWNPNTTSWTVFEDVCPHRLVPLSEGRINTHGNLECGYHGWEFSGSGKCERIPQGGTASSARACVKAFPCAVRQGLIFVKPKALPNAALAPPGSDAALAVAAEVASDAEARIPIVPELEDPDWNSQDVWRDLPMGYETLLENVMDVSHVPFTHHKSISNRNMIGDFKISMTSPMTVHGFSGNWPTGPRAGKLGPQATEFTAPSYMKHKLDGSKIGFEAITVVYCVPMAPGRCRLINRNCQRFIKAKAVGALFKLMPTWVGHLGSHIPLEDDQIFLHIGEATYLKRRVQGQTPGQAYYMPSPADTLVAGFRTWLDKWAGGGPFGRPTEATLDAIGPRWSRDQLLDRYTYHTANCASCQKGLKQVRTALSIASGLRAVFSAVAVLTAAVAVALGPVVTELPHVDYSVVPELSSTSGPTQRLGSVLLSAVRWLAMGTAQVTSSDVLANQMLRSAGWLVAALVAHAAVQFLKTTELKFYKGDYPPMRNTATDP